MKFLNPLSVIYKNSTTMLNTYMIKTFYVYMLYDENKTIRYIGKANDSYNRIQRHFKRSSNPQVRQFINDNWSSDIVYRNSDEKSVLNEEIKLIKEHKITLYNESRGGEGGPTKDGDGNMITLKNLKTGEIKTFKSNLLAARYIGCSNSYIGKISSGKYLHYKLTWVLEPTTQYILDNRPISRNHPKPGLRHPVTIFDNKEEKYLSFNSLSECGKFIKIAIADVCLLVSGKAKTLKYGRYTMAPSKGTFTKSVEVYDTKEKKVLKFDSRVQFAKHFNFDKTHANSLMNGKMKSIIKNRFITIETAIQMSLIDEHPKGF